MKVRKFRKEDAEEICGLVKDSFNKFVSSSFTKKGSKNFLNFCNRENIIKKSEDSNVFVGVIDGKIVGTVSFSIKKGTGKIGWLFVHKDYQRNNIARALMSKAEEFYVRKGIKSVRVNSSVYAQKFYEKLGYKKSTGLIKKDGWFYQPMGKVL